MVPIENRFVTTTRAPERCAFSCLPSIDSLFLQDVALTGDMKTAMKDTGLSEEFLDSPKEVMQATLQYLDTAYGSPRTYEIFPQVALFLFLICGHARYLEKIGVPAAVQDKIKEILTLPAASRSASPSVSPSPSATPVPPSASDDVCNLSR